MRYIWQHIKTIIEEYKGELPLAQFLKNYFRKYPILGSRDRRVLSAMAYSWYRCHALLTLGQPTPDAAFEEKIRTCLRLCDYHFPVIFPQGDIDVPTNIIFDTEKNFPDEVPFSAGINRKDWLLSMLQQPKLFIRIRKDKGKIISSLNTKGIKFEIVTDACLALPNGSDIETLLPPDCYVVQDASSQQTGSFFHPKKNEEWLDCCSGAGGKSLLLKDLEPGVRLTVTDKRESIIHNLQQRFRQYRHVLPVAHVTDVSNRNELTAALGSKLFNHIICDAPCSGSGTWSRTPEQLHFFKPGTLASFSALQSEIAINVSQHLKPGGTLFYITCSVFQTENEQVVAKIMQATDLKLIESHLINGIALRADSMFIAVLQKPGL